MPIRELGWHLGRDWRRLGLGQGAQEVSHRGREIAGLGVRTATVTVSLQDGCGFADRESAAWTCQRCRSEVSSGEPGPPRPHRPRRGPTGARHLLPISGPSARGSGWGGTEASSPGPALTGQKGHRGQRNQGDSPGARAKQKRPGNRGLLWLARSEEILLAPCRRAAPGRARSVPPASPGSCLWLVPHSRFCTHHPRQGAPALLCARPAPQPAA